METELAALVNIIEEHAIEPLTQKELYEAISAAGVTVAEGENWRMRLHRMRVQGLVPRRRKTNEVEIVWTQDDNIDWAAMDARSRNIVRKMAKDVASKLPPID